MNFAVQPSLPITRDQRLSELPRQSQFVLLTLRLGRELSVEDRNFQGFVYTLCGVCRIENALAAVREVFDCLGRAPRELSIESTVVDDIAEDERRLLELLRSRWDFGLARAGQLVPRPFDERLIKALNRLADILDARPYSVPAPAHPGPEPLRPVSGS